VRHPNARTGRDQEGNTMSITPRVVTAGRETLSRAVRQVLQTLIPTLLIVASGTVTGISVRAVAVLALMTALVTVLKAIAGVKATASSPAWVQLVDRAGAAAAGTALGYLTIDGGGVVASVDWQAAAIATAGSAILAVVMAYATPPTVEGTVITSPGDVPAL
jgi:hypothetical protein